MQFLQGNYILPSPDEISAYMIGDSKRYDKAHNEHMFEFLCFSADSSLPPRTLIFDMHNDNENRADISFDTGNGYERRYICILSCSDSETHQIIENMVKAYSDFYQRHNASFDFGF